MQKLFTILLLNLLFTFSGFSQSSLWSKQATQKGTFMLGAGPTYVGGTAKAGVFLNNNILVGVSAEAHDLFSMRKEAGLFARKYINRNRFMVYIQPGLSYGTFESNDFDIETGTESQELTALKLNFSAGGEIRISEMISFEGEAGMGRVMSANWWAPSIRTSINFRIKSSKR